MLDLASLFELISLQAYSIIKISDKFPQYRLGEDIDIFCYDPQQMGGKILEWGGRYAEQGLIIKVKDDRYHNHIHVDFMQGEKLHLRFDLYGRLPIYKKLVIKPAFFESIIENSKEMKVDCNNRRINVRVPDEIDDLLLRYIEFMEWYNVRPDKIKHLEFIMNNSDEKKKGQLLNKLHHYTAVPDYPPINHIKLFLLRCSSRIKGKSIPEIFAGLCRVIKNTMRHIIRTVYRRLGKLNE